jgi:glycosyltransferase involved in cell wall biosynthesis
LPTVSIVVPCFNEAHRLPRDLFADFLRQAGNIRLIFVDDGSTDSTLRVLNELQQAVPDHASVLSLSRNSGKAEAVRAGMRHAIATGETRYAGFWDADLATPLDAISRFTHILDTMPGIEMVFGSRVKLLGRDVVRSALRHYVGRVFATAVSLMLKLPIYDTQCGAKLFRVNAHLADALRDPFLSRWIFDVEIIARYGHLLHRNMNLLEQIIYEYPLERWRDVGGSKLRPQDFVRAMVDLVRIWNRYIR